MSDENDIDDSDQLPDNVVELRPFRPPATWDVVVEGFGRVYGKMTEIVTMVTETRAQLQREKGEIYAVSSKFG